jgi:hypothetical protein
MNWVHGFGSLSEAFHVGRAKVAVVDERAVNMRGVEAWMWMALAPIQEAFSPGAELDEE